MGLHPPEAFLRHPRWNPSAALTASIDQRLPGGNHMRLDKYLKISRLIKRRTVANEACDHERVLVNGKAAKASYDVKVGDRITILFGTRQLSVEVLDVAENVRKDDAAALYRELPPM